MDEVIPIRKPTIVGEAGGLVDGCQLTLSIHRDELDPDEISRILGCAPTGSHRRGDSGRSGTPRAQGAWLYSVEAKAPTGPEELVHLLLARLPTDDLVWANLRARFKLRLSFGIFTERWNRGFDLTPQAVSRISAFGAGLDVDI